MGLLSILKKVKTKEREMRILMLGLDNAGKTTIVKKFNQDDITGISPTLGFNIRSLEHNGYILNVWDVGGQQCLRSYWRNYFEQTDGIIWVVDSNDVQRLEDCKAELHALLPEERLAGATLLIMANKQDIPSALSIGEVLDAIGADALRNTHRHVHAVACSAHTGDGLLDGVEWLVNDIAQRIFTGD
eukprot:PhM_4_TR13158/c0_g1_i1/m.25224/K07943/ARL2; ADP-ribosylation factor-like protein 2